MKKTIKEENERQVIFDYYLNDNALMECQLVQEKEEYVRLVVRYISTWSIREDELIKLSLLENFYNFSDFVEINPEEDTIAIFKKVEEGYQLERIYDSIKHEFVIDEFIDVVYAKKFPSSVNNLNKYFVKKPKTNC